MAQKKKKTEDEKEIKSVLFGNTDGPVLVVEDDEEEPAPKQSSEPEKEDEPSKPLGWHSYDASSDIVMFDDTPVHVNSIEMEVPASTRLELQGQSGFDGQAKVLEKYYDDVAYLDEGRGFIMLDRETGRPVILNRTGWMPSMGDVADWGLEIAGTAGSIYGGAKGAVVGGAVGSAVPVAGTTAGALTGGALGAGAGYSAGKEAGRAGINWLYGNEDDREWSDVAKDVAIDTGIGAVGAGVGTVAAPLLRKGTSAAARGIGRAINPRTYTRGSVAVVDDAGAAATRLQNFDKLGIQPTPGMIGGEKAAARELNAATTNQVRQEGIDRVYSQVDDRLTSLTDDLSGGYNPTAAEAGEALQSRMTDAGSRLTQRRNELYDEVGARTSGIAADIGETSTYLNKIKAEKGKLGQSGLMNRGKAYDDVIQQGDAIVADASSGKATFDTLKELRSSIGEIAFDRNTPNASAVLHKNFYNALSRDMEKTAAAAGDDALQALRKANNFNRRLSNPDSVISRQTSEAVLKKQTPEAVTQMLLSGSKKAGTNINKIINQVKLVGGDDAVQQTRAVVFQNLGRNADGAFSPSKLVKDWSVITPEAKSALFNTADGKFLRQRMDDIVQVSKQLVEHQKPRNTSNTARHLMDRLDSTINMGSVIGGVTTGNPSLMLLPVLKAGAGYFTRKSADKFFSSPETLRWMAGLGKQKSTSSAFNLLNKIATRTSDENLKFAIREYLQDYNREPF